MQRPIILIAIGLILLGSIAASAQFDSVGSIDFPTSSVTKEAQYHFLRGVAILHGFGWKQAIEQFRKAQELEPDFAMAIPCAWRACLRRPDHPRERSGAL